MPRGPPALLDFALTATPRKPAGLTALSWSREQPALETPAVVRWRLKPGGVLVPRVFRDSPLAALPLPCYYAPGSRFMRYELKLFPLERLANAYKNGHLPINRENQRGPKWKRAQNQALIDSLLRGYRLPLFYVHLVEEPDDFTDGVRTTRYLVDGQQRLQAVKLFMQNAFALADPQKERQGVVVPTSPEATAGWRGKKWDDLAQEDRQRFLSQELLVMEMREEQPNEVRGLFIRLQSGTPLTPQEKRDAWPGDFTEFVIRHVGKPDTETGRHPHRFFELVPRRLGPRRRVFGEDEEEDYVDGLADARKFFAGLAMTIMRRERDGVDFVDLKGATINSFYLANFHLPPDDPAAGRVARTLDCVVGLRGFDALANGPKLKFTMAFHLALLVDALNSGSYTNTWKNRLVEAFRAFQERVAKGRLRGEEAGGALLRYADFARRLSGGGSDTAVEIRRRHAFFSGWMYRTIPIELTDPDRNFDPIEKEVIWYRDGRRCRNPDCKNYQEVGGEVPFREATVHHVVEHCAGGPTRLENGVLVCPVCHSDKDLMLRLKPHFQEHLRRVCSGRAQETGGDADGGWRA